jgi:glycosyltransferase involved in cell wall biosynthesis
MRRTFQITKTRHGGGGVYTARLNEGLVGSGWRSSVFCLDDSSLSPRRSVPNRFAEAGDRVLSGICHRASSAPFHSFLRVREWNTSVTAGSDDIVHLHSITGFIGSRGLKRLLRKRPRVFWTAHNPWLFTGGCVAYAGCDGFTEGCRSCPILMPPLNRLAKHELRSKRRFIEYFGVTAIANSEWMAEMMRRSPIFAQLETIPVVPPIVDEVFTVLRDQNQSREALALDDDRFVVGLSASSLTDPGKGIGEFFQKLPTGAKWLNAVTFLLIGDGKVAIPPGIDARFTGRVSSSERLAELYGACDCFVSSSFMETFGMAIMEAQACGTPVVAFEAGGTPEAVFPKEPCRLIPNRNFHALHEALEACVARGRVDSPTRAELSRWVNARHGAAEIARRQIEIYNA